jgi:hypothetical protein
MLEELISAWRASQQRVNELERQYADAMLAYSRGEGPPPPAETRAELLALRNEAKELLTRALTEIDQRMKDIERSQGGV